MCGVFSPMIFHKTPIEGARVIELEKRGDERGFFARAYCAHEFAQAGLEAGFDQANNSNSAAKGTLRGLHYQLAPDDENKLVRCIKGALFDLILDVRPASPTFGKWFGAELTADNRKMMFVPRGCAHGFLTLSDDVETIYFAKGFYAPQSERGIRWNDPKFAIDWPFKPVVVSDKDSNWLDFNPEFHLGKQA